MSTSLLYHGFGIRGYAYVRTEYRHGQVFFTIRQGAGTLRLSLSFLVQNRPAGGEKTPCGFRFRFPIGTIKPLGGR